MADQHNALPDRTAPAEVQQNAEPAQNLPQELEPIAEQAPAPGPADEVNLLFLVHLMLRVSYAAFLVFFFPA